MHVHAHLRRHVYVSTFVSSVVHVMQVSLSHGHG